LLKNWRLSLPGDFRLNWKILERKEESPVILNMVNDTSPHKKIEALKNFWFMITGKEN